MVTAVMETQECISGGIWMKRVLRQSLWQLKKSLLYIWFKVLLLVCVGILMLSLYLMSCSASWQKAYPLQRDYQSLVDWLKHHPKWISPEYRVTVNEVIETEDLTTTSPPTTVSTDTPQYHHAHPHNYHFVLDNKEVCKNKAPFLVLMVPVEPFNMAARNAIRKTWGNESLVEGKEVLTLFVLGLPRNAADRQQNEKLEKENLQHHDLVQSSFMDTYLNLTTKTMVIMDWLATRCPTAAYAMKIDSDMFLNVGNLVKMLTLPGIPKKDYLTGYMMVNRQVVRDKGSKWYVPEEFYPDSLYPTYTLGMGYVFSNDLTGRFVEVSKSIKPFNIEDAYIGMCMKKLGLEPVSPPNPWQFQAYSRKLDRCTLSKVITNILFSPQEIILCWTELMKPGDPCLDNDM